MTTLIEQIRGQLAHKHAIRYIDDDRSLQAENSFEEGFDAMLAIHDELVAPLLAALEFTKLNGYLCGHDDPSWCTEKCMPVWKSKEALKAYRQRRG